MQREKLAVVGSRKGADLQAVESFLWDLHGKHPDWVVVSGGADGVDDLAERTWRGLGHEVESYRPVKLERGHGWGIERHHWKPGDFLPTIQVSTSYPSVSDRLSALWLRSWVVASEASTRVVAFLRPGGSKGTLYTIDLATAHLGAENVRVFGGESLGGFGTMAGSVDLAQAPGLPHEEGRGARAEDVGEVVRAPGLEGGRGPDEEGLHSEGPLGSIDSPWRRRTPLVRKSGLNDEETYRLRLEMLDNLEDAMLYGFRAQAADLAGLGHDV